MEVLDNVRRTSQSHPNWTVDVAREAPGQTSQLVFRNVGSSGVEALVERGFTSEPSSAQAIPIRVPRVREVHEAEAQLLRIFPGALPFLTAEFMTGWAMVQPQTGYAHPHPLASLRQARLVRVCDLII